MSKKWVSTRFASPTQDFDLDNLVRRLRRGFFLALGSAVALLLIVVAINPFKEDEKKAPRPLTTKFIKREPRLTKPLELRKNPPTQAPTRAPRSSASASAHGSSTGHGLVQHPQSNRRRRWLGNSPVRAIYLQHDERYDHRA